MTQEDKSAQTKLVNDVEELPYTKRKDYTAAYKAGAFWGIASSASTYALLRWAKHYAPAAVRSHALTRILGRTTLTQGIIVSIPGIFAASLASELQLLHERDLEQAQKLGLAPPDAAAAGVAAGETTFGVKESLIKGYLANKWTIIGSATAASAVGAPLYEWYFKRSIVGGAPTSFGLNQNTFMKAFNSRLEFQGITVLVLVGSLALSGYLESTYPHLRPEALTGPSESEAHLRQVIEEGKSKKE